MTDDPHGEDVAFIRALAELLRECDLTELEVKRDYDAGSALNVRLSRAAPAALATIPPPMAPQPASHMRESPDPGAPGTGEAADPASHPGAVTSPMVGTAYLQPEPTADTFVRVGSAVTEGQTLLIIEAMKTMNQIAAPRAGTVTRILVADGSPVEYGAPLMIIE